MEWAAEATWSYESGSKVNMAGTLIITDGVWQLEGPSGGVICVIPTVEDMAEAELQNYSGSIRSSCRPLNVER